MPEFTDAEKLELVEHMITQWRPARSSSIEGERDTFLILKSIAADIRARHPAAPGRARDRVGRAVDHAKTMKDGTVPGAYRGRDMFKIAEVVISEWPVIKAALEQFEQRENTDA